MRPGKYESNSLDPEPWNRMQVLVYQTPTSIYTASIWTDPRNANVLSSGKFPNILAVQFAFAPSSRFRPSTTVQRTIRFLFRTYPATIRNVARKTND